MKLTLFFGVLLSLAAAYDAAAASIPNNVLSPEERRDGYELLWNGKDFSGWKEYGNTSPIRNWKTMLAYGSEAGVDSDPDSTFLKDVAAGQSLYTKDSSYRDLDLKLEWQAPVGQRVSSGVDIHYLESVGENYEMSSPKAMIANSLWTAEWRTDLNTAGCDYDMVPLLPARKNPDKSPNWVRPDGQWNELRIISYGRRTAHFGNGLRLLEYQMLSEAWNAAYKVSKYGRFPKYKDLHAGSILLIDHGNPGVRFRNIRIKRLTRDPWAQDSPYLNKIASAMGDTALIDSLPTSANLFPVKTDRINRPVPPASVRFLPGPEGLAVILPDPGAYTLRWNDVRGIARPFRQVHSSDRIIAVLPATPAMGVLSVWRQGKKIQERILIVP